MKKTKSYIICAIITILFLQQSIIGRSANIKENLNQGTAYAERAMSAGDLHEYDLRIGGGSLSGGWFYAFYFNNLLSGGSRDVDLYIQYNEVDQFNSHQGTAQDEWALWYISSSSSLWQAELYQPFSDSSGNYGYEFPNTYTKTVPFSASSYSFSGIASVLQVDLTGGKTYEFKVQSANGCRWKLFGPQGQYSATSGSSIMTELYCSSDSEFTREFSISTSGTYAFFIVEETTTGGEDCIISLNEKDLTPPSIGTVSGEVDPIDQATDQTLSCTVTDSGGSGLDWARIFYRTQSQSWSPSRYATISAGSATIPESAYAYGDNVYYYVGAKDIANNFNYRGATGETTNEATAQSNAFVFLSGEFTVPTIGTVSGEIDPISSDVDQVLSCTVTDSGGSGLDWARIFYRTQSQSWSPSRYATISGSSGTIPESAYAYGDTLYYYVGAKDNANNFNYRHSSGTTTVESTAQSNAFSFSSGDLVVPTIGSVSGEVDPISESTNQVLGCTVSDSGGSGLDWQRIFYRTQAQSWSPSRYATISGGSATIPESAYVYGDTVYYYVGARDNANNFNYRHSSGTTTSEATAQSNAFSFAAEESVIPTIGTVSGEVDPIDADVDQVLGCTVSDSGGSGLDWGRIFYRTQAQSWNPLRYASISAGFATIPNADYAYGNTVYYYVGAKDNANNYNYRHSSGTTTSEATAQSNAFSFIVTETTIPSVGTVSGEVDPIDADTDQILGCTVSDSGGSGLEWGRIFYRTQAQSWSSSRYATISGGVGTIPNTDYAYSDTVYYYIGAKDYANNYNYRYSSGTTTNEVTARSSPFSFTVNETTVPSIGAVTGEVDPIDADTNQVLGCTVSDSGGSSLDWGRIFYRTQAQSWSPSRYITISGSNGVIPSSSYAYGDTVYYYIGAKDNANNYNYRHSSGTTTNEVTAQSTAFSFVVTETTAPTIGDVSGEVDPLGTGYNQTLTCNVTDLGGSGFLYARIYYRTDTQSWSPSRYVPIISDVATIPCDNLSEGVVIYYYIAASDNANNIIYRHKTGTTSTESVAQDNAFYYTISNSPLDENPGNEAFIIWSYPLIALVGIIFLTIVVQIKKRNFYIKKN